MIGETESEDTMETATVYSKPGCIQCTMTYRELDKQGIIYNVVDVTETPAALEYVTGDLGYSSAPIVVIDDNNHWAGFRPDLIARINE